jgi:hypothetical protein
MIELLLVFKKCYCYFTPLVDLPVGQYLQDKYGALIGPFLVSEGKCLVYDRDYTLVDFLQWIKFGTGKLKSSLSKGTWPIYSERARVKTTKRQSETNERSQTFRVIG